MLTILVTTIPDADPLALPAPPWVLWALLILTFSLHIAAMNFVLGGSIITAIARWRGGEPAKPLVTAFGKAMPSVMAAAITLGVAPLLFLQALYGRLFFTSAVLMAWIWFAVVPLVMVAYYGMYAISFGARAKAIVSGVVAVVLIAIAFIYSTNMTMMLRPERFLDMYAESARGAHLNLDEPTIYPRFLHMLAGALAVAGMCVALFGVYKRDEWAKRQGSVWFVGGTLANVLTGIWWLGVLPHAVMMRVTPESTIGAVAGFAALAAIYIGRTKTAAVALAVSLVAMVLARDQVRRGMLDLAGFISSPRIEAQWDVIAIFAVLLVGALATVAWMVRISLHRAPSPR